MGPVPAGIAVTNAKGRFSLGDLPEGEIVLQAYAAERGRGREKVRVHAGSLTRDVRIRLDEATPGKEEAAGASVAITLTESGSRTKRVFTIETVAPGSTAEVAGLRAEDVIVSIDDHVPESLEGARKRLSGALGDDVLIVVLREGERHVFRVARERVRR